MGISLSNTIALLGLRSELLGCLTFRIFAPVK